MKKLFNYFTLVEIFLWGVSVLGILVSFLCFDRQNYLTLIASLIGVTSLIFCAKANPIGQVLMVLFSLIYAFISFKFSYYGELLTYVGMTLPMSIIALVSWLKNPYNGNRAQVKVGKVSLLEIVFMTILASVITIAFYFILKYFNTKNLVFSTISVTTSFIAVYLTFRRSPYFALAYATNDIILIVLWVLACLVDVKYVSVVVCFVAFLFNDIYGFISWKKLKISQNKKA